MYDAGVSKLIGVHDEISLGIRVAHVVRDVIVHDRMGNMVEFGMVVCLCGALVKCFCCRMAGRFCYCCAVGADSATIDSENYTKMVTLLSILVNYRREYAVAVSRIMK